MKFIEGFFVYLGFVYSVSMMFEIIKTFSANMFFDISREFGENNEYEQKKHTINIIFLLSAYILFCLSFLVHRISFPGILIISVIIYLSLSSIFSFFDFWNNEENSYVIKKVVFLIITLITILLNINTNFFSKAEIKKASYIFSIINTNENFGELKNSQINAQKFDLSTDDIINVFNIDGKNESLDNLDSEKKDTTIEKAISIVCLVATFFIFGGIPIINFFIFRNDVKKHGYYYTNNMKNNADVIVSMVFLILFLRMLFIEKKAIIIFLCIGLGIIPKIKAKHLNSSKKSLFISIIYIMPVSLIGIKNFFMIQLYFVFYAFSLILIIGIIKLFSFSSSGSMHEEETTFEKNTRAKGKLIYDKYVGIPLEVDEDTHTAKDEFGFVRAKNLRKVNENFYMDDDSHVYKRHSWKDTDNDRQ